MGWSSIDPDLKRVAEEVCTERQLEVLKLRAAGWGVRRMALALGITTLAVRDRLAAAERKIIDRMEAEGV